MSIFFFTHLEKKKRKKKQRKKKSEKPISCFFVRETLFHIPASKLKKKKQNKKTTKTTKTRNGFIGCCFPGRFGGNDGYSVPRILGMQRLL